MELKPVKQLENQSQAKYSRGKFQLVKKKQRLVIFGGLRSNANTNGKKKVSLLPQRLPMSDAFLNFKFSAKHLRAPGSSANGFFYRSDLQRIFSAANFKIHFFFPTLNQHQISHPPPKPIFPCKLFCYRNTFVWALCRRKGIYGPSKFAWVQIHSKWLLLKQ